MADAFKGLTIRLGGDARPLTQALNSVKASAGEAQRGITRLTKALNFNPADAGAMQSRLTLMGEKAQLAARSAQRLRTAMQQAAAQSAKLTGHADIGKAMDGAYANAHRYREELKHVNTQIQLVHDAAAKAMVGSDRFADVKNMADAEKEVRKLARAYNESADARSKLNGLMKSSVMSGSVVSPLGLGSSMADANELIGTYQRLKGESVSLSKSLQKAKYAQGYKEAVVQLAAYEAELRQAASEQARFAAELRALGGVGGWGKEIAQVNRFEESVEQSRAALQKMSAAYENAPKNIEAAIAKMNAMRSSEQALVEKSNALKAALGRISESPGFDRMKAETTDVYSALSKATHELSEYNAKLAQSKERLAALKSALKSAVEDGGLEKNRAAVEALGSEYREAAADVQKYKSKVAGADEAVRVASVNKQWRDQHDELVSVNSELENMQHKSKTAFWNNVANFGGSIKGVGYAMYSTLSPALMMTGRYAIQAASDVDSSYRDMRKTVNGTEEDFEHLKKAALEYSTTHVTSADQMLEIESIGGQLGIAVGNLEAFGKTVSNLDIATNMDTEDIALGLAKMSNILHFGREEYDSFADSLVRLGNNEPALESDIMAISTRFAGMAANVGMSAADVLAFATAATATGQKAESAGGSIQRTIGNIEKAVAKGGKSVKGFADIAGMSADEFAKTWKDAENGGPTKVITSFVEGLKRVKDNGGSVTAALAGLGITGVRDSQLLSGLTNTIDVLEESLRMSNDAWNGMSTTMADGSIERAGDAAREAQRKSEGFSGELQMMKNNATMLAVEMSEGAVPIIQGLGDLFQGFTSAVSNMDGGMKTFAVGLGLAAAATGPVLVGIGSVLTAAGNMRNMIANMPTAWNKLTTAEMGSAAASKVMARQMEISALAAKRDELQRRASIATTERSKKAYLEHAVAAERDMAAQEKAISRVKMGQKALNVAKGVGKFVGASLAIEGVIALGSYLVQLKERADRLQGSGQVLAHMFDGLGAGALQNVETATVSLNELKTAVDNAAQANIDMGANLASSLTQVANNSATLDDLVERVRSLTGESELSANQMDDLRAAVKQFNELAGTNYTVSDGGKVLDEEGKKVKDLVGKYEELAAAKKRTWQMEAMGDAYTESLKNATDSYAKLQEAMARLEKMESEKAGMEGMLERAKAGEDVGVPMEELIQSLAAAQGSIDAYRPEVEQLAEQYGIALTASDRLSSSTEALSAAVENAKSVAGVVTSFDQFQAALNANGLGAQDLVGSLEGLGYSYDSLKGLSTEAVQSIEENWTGGLSQLNALLADNGVKVGEAATSMASLAESAGLSAQGFSALYQSSGGNLDTLKAQIDLISQMTSKNIDITVDDKGTISTTSEQIRGLDYIKVGNKLFSVSDNGTIAPAKKKLDEIDKKAKVKAVKKVEVEGNATDGKGQGKTDAMAQSIDKVKDKRVSVGASVSGESAVQSLKNQIASLSGKTVYVNVVKRTSSSGGGNGGGQAAGGVNMRQIRALPRHADGMVLNGIVTRATLTNQGLVGEAGDEALVGMGRRAAVIPLSNRRHVRPFARAVAAEMGGGTTVVNNYYSVGNVAYREGSNGAAAVKAFVKEVHTSSRK